MNTQLSEATVRQRLASYKDPTVTDELYGFGQALVHDAIDRLSKSDTKAGAMAAYNGALLALLASTASIWTVHLHSWQRISPILAVACLFFAAMFAISSIGTRKTDWHSSNEWMKEECLTSGERLRRYHVLTMWGAYGSLNSAYSDKMRDLKRSEWLTLASWLFLVITFLQITMSTPAF